MKDIIVTINSAQASGRDGMTILELAQENGINIPTLCHDPLLTPTGACQVCLVEDVKADALVTSCDTPIVPGMVINTDSPRVIEARKNIVELILAKHPDSCIVCDKANSCQLRKIAADLEIGQVARATRYYPIENDLFIERNPSFCILCGKCVRVCQEVRGVGAWASAAAKIDFAHYEGDLVASPASSSLLESGCKFCGACVEICPTAALMDRDEKKVARADRENAIVPCRYACPAHIDVPLYVRLISQGKYAQALAVVREKIPFAHICGLICLHPCELACRRNELNDPIAIRELKRFAVEHAGEPAAEGFRAPATGKRVAIVGSGPAGLTAAYYLAKLGGHDVTVFEALPKAGGMMRLVIPEYRLPRAVLDAEINMIESLGVDIKTNTRVNSIDSLFRDGYDAIFVAIGAHKGLKMGVEGEDGPGVMECLSFLRDVNLGKKVRLGQKVAIIGGGNAAIDASRTAVRLGAKQVVIMYRRTRAEMPAEEEEIEKALEEGVELQFLVAPTKISRNKGDGTVTLECIRMQLGKIDATGRPRPEPIPGSESSTDFDTVIVAIGQAPDVPGEFHIPNGRGNTVLVDPRTLATNRAGVFAGGDAVSGPASVIEAIAAGRQAAISIDKFLGGSGIIDEILAPPEKTVKWLGKEEGFVEKRRVSMPSLPVEQRLNNFTQVELGFTEQMAIEEAKRCLKCDLRLQFKQVVTPCLLLIDRKK